jgi:hypothetical protein
MTTAGDKSSLLLLRLLVLGLAALASLPFPALADTDDDSSESAKTNDDTYVRLASKGYRELERQFSPHLDSYAKGTISEVEFASKFAVFYRSYGLESRFDEWVSAYPKSYTARLARGMYLISDAWRKRGSNFSRETTDEQFRGFTEQMRNAASDLEVSIGLYARPVESYRYLIQISMGLGLHTGRGLLDAALELDPQAYNPRYIYLYSITPKWGGSVRQMESFIEDSRRSPMSDKDKARLEVQHHSHLGEQASWDKEYMFSSEHYLKAYQLQNDAKWLYRSGKSAMDGGFKDLAFSRFNELIKAHPKYEVGYTQRGFLYETNYKNDEKAFEDYLVAADLGSSWAQNRIGWWYMTGKYVALDYDKAELWLNRAAAQKNQTAIENLRNLEKLRRAGRAK